MRTTLKWLCSFCIALVLATGTAHAERSQQFDDYVVHYNALTTDMLQPAVARQYNIQRSKNRALLNIAVIRQGDSGTGQAVRARVEAVGTTLTGQQRVFELQEIREGDAIYYIGDFPVAHRESLNFSIRISPEGHNRSFDVSFRQEFFTN